MRSIMITCKVTLIFVLGALVTSTDAHAVCPGDHGAGSAAALDDGALDGLLLAAGFPQESLSTMRCIAHKESGAHPEAFCLSTGANQKVLAWGLFQISRLWFKQCSGYDDE